MEAVDPKLIISPVSRITAIIPLYTWNVYITEISLNITLLRELIMSSCGLHYDTDKHSTYMSRLII